MTLMCMAVDVAVIAGFVAVAVAAAVVFFSFPFYRRHSLLTLFV